MKMTEVVARGGIVVPLAAGDRDGVITELLDALVAAGVAPTAIRDELLVRVLDREKKGTTGFGRGVAVPHVKHKQIKQMAAGIGLSPRGVDFRALDNQPVYSVILLLSPEDRPEDHLQAMEVIFKNLSKDTFRRFLRQSATAGDVWSLLQEVDAQQLG